MKWWMIVCPEESICFHKNHRKMRVDMGEAFVDGHIDLASTSYKKIAFDNTVVSHSCFCRQQVPREYLLERRSLLYKMLRLVAPTIEITL